MKKILLLLVLVFPLEMVLAQPAMNLPLSVIVPMEQFEDSPSSGEYLKDKLQQFVAEEGIGEIAEDYSFLVFPKTTIIGQEITSGTPQMYVLSIELTCFVANAKPNNAMGVKSIIFNSKTFNLKGVGRSKEKAFLNAFRNLNKNKEAFYSFFKISREKINLYFKENCEAMINEAELLAKEANLSINHSNNASTKSDMVTAKFASGLNILKTLRIANTSCFEDKTEKIDNILSMYDDFACNNYLALAKNQWAKRDLDKTIEYLDKIPPSKKCKEEVNELLLSIEEYVDDPEKNIENKIRLWREAGGIDKARIEGEAYRYLQMDTRHARQLDAQSLSNRELLILK